MRLQRTCSTPACIAARFSYARLAETRFCSRLWHTATMSTTVRLGGTASRGWRAPLYTVIVPNRFLPNTVVFPSGCSHAHARTCVPACPSRCLVRPRNLRPPAAAGCLEPTPTAPSAAPAASGSAAASASHEHEGMPLHSQLYETPERAEGLFQWRGRESGGNGGQHHV